MFYLTYLRQELRRRLGRTIFTVLGLSVGVALVVATTALGAGLDRAQKDVLGPLSGVATDLTVTKRSTPFAEGGRFSAGLATDLSKLGKAGDKFTTDTFFSTQGNVTNADIAKVSSTSGVKQTSKALLLQGIHQSGVIPKITAKVQAGGQTVTQSQDIKPMTQAEQDAFQKCMDANGGNQPQQGGVDQGPGGPDGGGARFRAFNKCMPARFQRQDFTFRVPRSTITQDVNTPQTDINSNSFTIAGIEPGAELNLISPQQVTKGAFLKSNGQAMLSDGYATKNKLNVGSTIKLKSSTYTIVGIVKAPLGGTAADIYLTLGDLQKLSGRTGETNVLLARTDDASKVKSVSSSISNNVAGANVSDASDLAQQVAGSLVDSGNLIRRLGFVLAVVGIVAAILIAALLTLASVAKRTRELGTLKAIGWRPRLVVRQILAESLAQGVLGGIIGVAMGIGAAALLGTFAPALSARSVDAGGPGFGGRGSFGLGRFGDQAAQAVHTVHLTAPVSLWIILLAGSLAVVGGLVAGGIGSLRAAQLRPADAMREVA